MDLGADAINPDGARDGAVCVVINEDNRVLLIGDEIHAAAFDNAVVAAESLGANDRPDLPAFGETADPPRDRPRSSLIGIEPSVWSSHHRGKSGAKLAEQGWNFGLVGLAEREVFGGGNHFVDRSQPTRDGRGVGFQICFSPTSRRALRRRRRCFLR